MHHDNMILISAVVISNNHVTTRTLCIIKSMRFDSLVGDLHTM